MKERIAWIDYAKVICIWLMVCCHAGQKGMILNTAYQFHMPAFFIISGILYRPKGVKTTIKTFGVPIVFFGLLNLVYRFLHIWALKGFDSYALEWGMFREILSKWFTSFLFYTDVGVFPGYWFVLTLMSIRLVMEIKIVRNFKTFLALCCIIWCCVESFVSIPELIIDCRIYYIFSSFPLFALGMLIKERNINLMKGSFEFKMFCFVVFVVLIFVQGKPDMSSHYYGVSYLLFLFNALLGSYLLFNICNNFPNGKKYITTLSTGTFLILGLHSMMYGHIIGICYRFLGHHNMYLPLLSGLIVLVLCYPIIEYFNQRFPILLGKV